MAGSCCSAEGRRIVTKNCVAVLSMLMVLPGYVRVVQCDLGHIGSGYNNSTSITGADVGITSTLTTFNTSIPSSTSEQSHSELNPTSQPVTLTSLTPTLTDLPLPDPQTTTLSNTNNSEMSGTSSEEPVTPVVTPTPDLLSGYNQSCYFDLVLQGLDCQHWSPDQNEHYDQWLDVLLLTISDGIQSHCKCGFTQSMITDVEISCTDDHVSGTMISKGTDEDSSSSTRLGEAFTALVRETYSIHVYSNVYVVDKVRSRACAEPHAYHDTDDDLQLIVGLAVGLPLILLAIASIAFLARRIRRRYSGAARVEREWREAIICAPGYVETSVPKRRTRSLSLVDSMFSERDVQDVMYVESRGDGTRQ